MLAYQDHKAGSVSRVIGLQFKVLILPKEGNERPISMGTCSMPKAR